VPTITGTTPKMMAALRPRSGIIALSESENVRKRFGMYYGVESMGIEQYRTSDEMIEIIRKKAEKVGAKRYLVLFGKPNRPGRIDTIRYFEEQ